MLSRMLLLFRWHNAKWLTISRDILRHFGRLGVVSLQFESSRNDFSWYPIFEDGKPPHPTTYFVLEIRWRHRIGDAETSSNFKHKVHCQSLQPHKHPFGKLAKYNETRPNYYTLCIKAFGLKNYSQSIWHPNQRNIIVIIRWMSSISHNFTLYLWILIFEHIKVCSCKVSKRHLQ